MQCGRQEGGSTGLKTVPGRSILCVLLRSEILYLPGMTIWLLALITLASVAALGYRQGAIRVGFSFFGIVVGALLAAPLGHLLGRVLGIVGIKNPLLVWALGPVLVFVIISIVFKVAAAAVHQKAEVYYKYHAGELRMVLWERLNRRLGLCLGLLNGTAYLILFAFVIYVGSYATVQVASSDRDPRWMRLLNVMGRDLHGTGFDKVARSIDRIPQVDYNMIDFAALVYRNPLAQARLRSYPAFLSLAELYEFQTIGADKDFTESWERLEPVMTLLDFPSVLAIRGNPDLLKVIWTTVEPDLADLRTYLQTGRSPKYDPIAILGRWQFDVTAALGAVRRAKPNMPASEMQRVRLILEAAFSKTRMVAKPDNQVTISDVPPLKAALGAGPAGKQTLQGQWKQLDGTKYQLSLSGVELVAAVEGDRMNIKTDAAEMVFDRED